MTLRNLRNPRNGISLSYYYIGISLSEAEIEILHDAGYAGYAEERGRGSPPGVVLRLKQSVGDEPLTTLKEGGVTTLERIRLSTPGLRRIKGSSLQRSLEHPTSYNLSSAGPDRAVVL